METTVFGLYLTALLVALSYYDFKAFFLPDRLTLLLALGGAAHAFVIHDPAPLEAFIGAVLAALLLGSVAAFYKKWRGVDGLGFGDVKLLAAGALWIGPWGLGPALCVATFSALLVIGFVTLAQGAWKRDRLLPFGPFLALGILSVWLAGNFN